MNLKPRNQSVDISNTMLVKFNLRNLRNNKVRKIKHKFGKL